MTPWGKGIDRFAARGRLLRALVLAAMLIQVLAGPATAQMFSDQPPPVPPGSVPDPGGAISLAPPSGPGSVPTMPAPLTQPSLTQPSLTQPSIAALPPVAAPQGAAPPGQAVLSLTARYGKDLPAINAGLVWRVFTDRPDENGTFKLIREERGATPNIVLPPGGYVVHVTFGLVSAVRPVTLKSETDREAFLLPAGGLRIEGRVGTSKIPQNQISFAIYKGSQALANTAWSVITPGGDVIKESIGAFPRVVLSEGEYRAIAKNEGKVYERPFNVVNGVDGEVEVVAR